MMKELRLHTMNVVSNDFQYSVEKDVEAGLWQSHTQLNAEYKRILGLLRSQNQVVQKRKVDKLYRDFLKISQFFYRGYIQRLSGRFYIPELHQAARGLDLEPSSPAPTTDSAPGSPIRKSCYMTLVRLGDLARYRCQASDKTSKANFDTAVAYYSLASVLDPNDGSCHHQMAVLYQIQGLQLDIIFYFHRAVSIAKPYQLGLPNLEKAFKNLETQSNTKRGSGKDAVKDATDTMTKWFLRLQSLYFQGEEFTSRLELEKEVLHRLDLTVKGDGNEEVILKMILINIAAYGIALDKVKKNWTMQSSLSCQYLLQFSVRMALVLLRLFKSALEEEEDVAKTGESQEAGPESTTEFSAPLHKLLPLVRICIAWIYVSRGDLVQYQEFLEPFIREAYRLLAESLTLLIPYIVTNLHVIESQYLLPEDVEAVGLKLLSDTDLPLFLNSEIVQGVQRPKRRTMLKPRKGDSGGQFNAQTESLWRIREIVCCGVMMAACAGFPLAVSKGVEGWVYTEDSSTDDYLDGASLGQMLMNLKVGNYLRPSVEEDVPEDSTNSAADLGEADASHAMASVSSSSRPSQPAAEVDQGVVASRGNGRANFYNVDLDDDSDIVKMVDDLLDADDDPLSKNLFDADDVAQRSQAETSYGMHSSTANEVFGLINSPNMQLPVNPESLGKPDDMRSYFYPGATDVSGFRSKQDVSARKASLGGRAPVGPGDSRQTAGTSGGYRYLGAAKVSRLDLHRLSISGLKRQAPSPNAFGSGAIRGSENVSPYGAQAFNSNLPSMVNTRYESDKVQLPGYPPAMSSPCINAETGYTADNSHVRLSDNSAAQRTLDLQGAQLRGDVRSPAGGSGSASGLMPSVFPSTQDSASMSPTDVPSQQYAGDHQRPSSQGLRYRESPASAASSARLGSFEHQFPSRLSHGHPNTNIGSSLAFSNPGSSLWTSTPAHLAPPEAPAGTVGCNGNIFNASTPFGRIGRVNNRLDPTHFRNQAKAMFGDDGATDYDRQVLMGALQDTPRKN